MPPETTRAEETLLMPYRVLTPDSHGDETMKIAYDILLWRAFRGIRPPEELSSSPG